MTAEEFKIRFLQLYPKLFAVAMANIGNREDAKDVMQSLYVRLWEKRAELAVVDNDIGYCRAMLINLCRDRWRTKSLEPEWVREEEVDASEYHPCFEADDIRANVERFIARLPERQRRIMTMSIEGATTDEIIEATGLSVENVRTILYRTRQMLRELYNKLNG